MIVLVQKNEPGESVFGKDAILKRAEIISKFVESLMMVTLSIILLIYLSFNYTTEKELNYTWYENTNEVYFTGFIAILFSFVIHYVKLRFLTVDSMVENTVKPNNMQERVKFMRDEEMNNLLIEEADENLYRATKSLHGLNKLENQHGGDYMKQTIKMSHIKEMDKLKNRFASNNFRFYATHHYLYRLKQMVQLFGAVFMGVVLFAQVVSSKSYFYNWCDFGGYVIVSYNLVLGILISYTAIPIIMNDGNSFIETDTLFSNLSKIYDVVSVKELNAFAMTDFHVFVYAKL